jgi:hypothetical protein
MTSAMATARYLQCAAASLILTACRYATPSPPIRSVDLVHEFGRADKRPPVGFAIAERDIGGVRVPVIAAPVPSRLTLALPLPRHGVLHARAALETATPQAIPGVRLRLGVSDQRIYEGLSEIVLPPTLGTWTEVRADLSSYAGWKWSLFYRPDGITWRLVLAADALVDRPATVLWAAPEITTDLQSAREYAVRRQRLR